MEIMKTKKEAMSYLNERLKDVDGVKAIFTFGTISVEFLPNWMNLELSEREVSYLASEWRASQIRTWFYSLQSHTISGSFDSGKVLAKTKEEAMKVARLKMEADVKEINDILLKNGGHSIDVDLDIFEIELVD